MYIKLKLNSHDFDEWWQFPLNNVIRNILDDAFVCTSLEDT